MGNEETKPSRLERARKWLLGIEPQGVGTLLLGFAACLALWGTGETLTKILKIEENASAIKVTVEELKANSLRLAAAVDLLSAQVKEDLAKHTVESSEALKKDRPTAEEIKEAIETIPYRPLEGQLGTVVLMESKRKEAVERLLKANGPKERTGILKNMLEYVPAGVTAVKGP